MELFIKDRLYLSQILPEKNSFLEFNIKRSILSKTALTDKEKKHFNLKEDTEAGVLTWDSIKDKEEPTLIFFTKDELDYLKESCESLVSAPYPDDFWATVEKIYNAE